MKIGFDKEGVIKGGADSGVGRRGRGAGGRRGRAVPTGRYELGQIQVERPVDVSFNAGGPRAMRAPGCPQGTFADELMIDEVATMAGVDPLALRIKLCNHPERKKMLEMGGEMIGWGSRAKTGTLTSAVRRGFGVGSCAWGAGRGAIGGGGGDQRRWIGLLQDRLAGHRAGAADVDGDRGG